MNNLKFLILLVLLAAFAFSQQKQLIERPGTFRAEMMPKDNYFFGVAYAKLQDEFGDLASALKKASDDKGDPKKDAKRIANETAELNQRVVKLMSKALRDVEKAKVDAQRDPYGPGERGEVLDARAGNEAIRRFNEGCAAHNGVLPENVNEARTPCQLTQWEIVALYAKALEDRSLARARYFGEQQVSQSTSEGQPALNPPNGASYSNRMPEGEVVCSKEHPVCVQRSFVLPEPSVLEQEQFERSQRPITPVHYADGYNYNRVGISPAGGVAYQKANYQQVLVDGYARPGISPANDVQWMMPPRTNQPTCCFGYGWGWGLGGWRGGWGGWGYPAMMGSFGGDSWRVNVAVGGLFYRNGRNFVGWMPGGFMPGWGGWGMRPVAPWHPTARPLPPRAVPYRAPR